MQFAEKVCCITRKIPRGKVTTYKEIGKKLGTRAYRAVGSALKNNKNPIVVPCHRVVRSDGSVGYYSGVADSKKKIILLKKEGIEIKNRRIIGFEEVMFRF